MLNKLKAVFISLLAAAGSTQCFAADAPTITGSSAFEVAQRVSAQINTMDPLNEHGAFIYCRENVCWASSIVTGAEASIGLVQIATILDYDHIDAIASFIHSHPKATAFDVNIRHTLDVINKGPSAADYMFMTGISTQGLVAQPTSLFIIGPDAITREYEVPHLPTEK